MTVQAELDRLLSFYDEHKPEMKGKEVGVYLAPASVEKFATKADSKLWYRGYIIKPLNQAKKH